MELLTRFALGGLLVTVFAAIGELFTPKTFSGLFGASPAVSIASLALSFHKHGSGYVAIQARSMAIGGLALLSYAAACVVLSRRKSIPVWLGAGAAWLVWALVAFVGFAATGGLA